VIAHPYNDDSEVKIVMHKILLKRWRGWSFGSNLKAQQFTFVPNVAPQAACKCFITAQQVGLAVFAFSDQIL